MAYDKVFGLKETIYTLPPPKFFKKTWPDQIRQIYPDGIDKAAGYDDDSPGAPVFSFAMKKEQIQMENHKVKLVRKENIEKKIKAQQKPIQNMVHDLIGLSPNQSISSAFEKQNGLTLRPK